MSAASDVAPLPGGTVLPPMTLRDRFLAWRDRVVARPGFRQAVARFPLTRGVARAQARGLFDLIAGFVYSQVMLASVRLGLFDLLAKGPLTTADIARRVDLPEDAAEQILAAGAALGLFGRRSGGRWGLGLRGAVMVGNAALAGMIEHHAMLYADLADPVAMLRGARGGQSLAAYWAYAQAEAPGSLEPGKVAAYSGLMAASQPLVAAEVLDAVDVARFRCLLDVGGGEGAFLIAAAARAPALRLMLFDLPGVADRARLRFAAAGLVGRAEAVGGDFSRDALPEGADAISLVRVIHDHDDALAMRILVAAHRALPPGGTLILAEPMAGTRGAEAMGDAYFGFYLRAMGSGRPRRAAELQAMLRQAGFASTRQISTATPLVTGVLLARKDNA